MYFSKKLFTKTVALAAICASIATASFAAPQGTYDTSEIHVTGQASRSVAPSYAILTLGITVRTLISMPQNLTMTASWAS